MPSSDSDRNLLFGILALQMDFITREQLIAGMHAWVLAKEIPIAEHLVQMRALRPEHRALLDPLVDAHIRAHGDDPQLSLASISSFDALRSPLAALKDEQLDETIAHIPSSNGAVKEADPLATASIQVGSASSQGTRFRILRPHAEGGLGRVYVAHDGELGREVALKEIKAERADDPDSRSRFTREAEITGGLEHPGIVPVYGLGAYPDGRPFYAMRFIRGKSLKDAIERFHEKRKKEGHLLPVTEENLELRKLIQRLIDVCEAMGYAHSRGVLHRDLKPGNIMLGKYGETLVVDWGLAKASGNSPGGLAPHQPADTTLSIHTVPEPPLEQMLNGSTPTILGSTLGTPAYMSPEQACGRIDLLSAASDVFSLGAILYHVLVGLPPYVGATKEGILEDAQSGRFTRPSHFLFNEVPRELEAICLKAMAFRPIDRYASAKELAADLERWLADEPISAVRESWFQRIRRGIRKLKPMTAFVRGLVLVDLYVCATLLVCVLFEVVLGPSSELHLIPLFFYALVVPQVALFLFWYGAVRGNSASSLKEWITGMPILTGLLGRPTLQEFLDPHRHTRVRWREIALFLLSTLGLGLFAIALPFVFRRIHLDAELDDPRMHLPIEQHQNYVLRARLKVVEDELEALRKKTEVNTRKLNE